MCDYAFIWAVNGVYIKWSHGFSAVFTTINLNFEKEGILIQHMELTCIMFNLHFNSHTHSKYRLYIHGNAGKREIIFICILFIVIWILFQLSVNHCIIHPLELNKNHKFREEELADLKWCLQYCLINHSWMACFNKDLNVHSML